MRLVRPMHAAVWLSGFGLLSAGSGGAADVFAAALGGHMAEQVKSKTG